MHKQFYVYIHKKPDGTPFYVGKGHGKRAYNFYSRSDWHKNIVAKYGKNNIIIEIINCTSESQAFDLEKIYIKQIKDTGVCLVNLTDGGEGHCGFKYSQEARQKRSARLKEFYASDEGKRVNQELNKHRCGRKNTEETKRKMGEAHFGKKQTTEHKLAGSISKFGKAKSGYGIGLAGVSWVESQKAWRVMTTFNKVTTFHGYFKCLLDAAAFRLTLQK